MGGFLPPPAPLDSTTASPRDIRDRDVDQWLYVVQRPTIPINIVSGAASAILVGRACILAGWSLRETTGTADLQVEFIDGNAQGGAVVGEQTISAPLPGSVGFVDVDVDSTANIPAAANTATLAALAGATTFITGFEVTGLGATAQATVTVTVGGVLGGSKTYSILIPAGITLSITPLIVAFSRPIPGSALNTAITVAATSPGAGNTAFNVTAHGFQRTLGSTAAQTGQSATSDLGEPGVFCRSGLFLRVITGSVVGSAWVRV